MGFAQRPGWPLAEKLAAMATEAGIKIAIPAGIYGGYKAGEWVGEQVVTPGDE